MRDQIKRGLWVSASVVTLATMPQIAVAQAAPPTPAPAPAPSPTPATATAPAPAPAPSSTSSDPNPIRPYSGTIRAFSGTIRAFSGTIRAFWGDVNGFWSSSQTFGNANNPYDASNLSFWGDLSLYNGSMTTNAPAWGAVGNFWTANGTAMNTINTSWTGLGAYSSSTSANYAGVAQQLGTLLNGSAATWGKSITAATGKSFNDGFVAPLLTKYGIDLNNPQTLANADPSQFLFAYYDGLMSYSGRAHVDHWMKEADYTPEMTQEIGNGARATIGVLDQAISIDTTKNLTSFSPGSTFTTGHGDAVASLLVADPAKLGVMGIAPMAQVVTYNPFDSTGTAGWSDVQSGVIALSTAGAGVINASLGVPGWTLNEGWNQVFSNSTVASATKNTVFVIAAGNDGLAQTQNILWNFNTNPNFIVVGSTNPLGTISGFSNMPGTACLTPVASTPCAPGNRLMDHFITAPGEMILVSDGNGGLTRMSGTSFAAPLVSGTVALLDDRWPWLANYSAETVSIILQTARPISDGSKPTPGSTANPTYGVGALDVGAALSPIDFNKIQYYQSVNGQIVAVPTTALRDPKQQAKWNAPGMYFYGYETIGRTFRDFAIPMDSSLVNQSVMSTYTGSLQQFQYYITSRMQTWMGGAAPAPKPAGLNFSPAAPMSFGLDMSVAATPKQRLIGYRQSEVPFDTAVRLSDPAKRFALTMGTGPGALAMSDRSSFGSASEYDPYTGGANPVLGYASGGAYGEMKVALNSRLTIATGISQRALRRDPRGASIAEQMQLDTVKPYQSNATKVSLGYDLGVAEVTGTYTHLHEPNAILGEQSINPYDIARGSSTDGATLDARVPVTRTLSFDATGTFSRTMAGGAQNYITSGQGLQAVSWQFGVSKDHLIDRHDAVRITLAQPLHIEDGGFDYSYVKVVDRQTGTLGVATQHIDLGSTTRRNLVSDVSYAHDLAGGRAQFRLFGRANLAGNPVAGMPSLMAGTGVNLVF